MSLSAERKIKFWLSTIAKVLVIALVAFKLLPFLFGSDETNDDKTDNVKSGVTKTNNDSVEMFGKSMYADTPQEKLREEHKGNGAITIPSTTKPDNFENSMAVFIFNESFQDRDMAGQLEKTILNTYHVKPIATSPNKDSLLKGELKSMGEVENVCVGTVSYTFKENNGKITCELRLNVDTYSTLSGFKIKNLSGSLVRYGIGFSREQAKQVAMKKVTTL